jgi:glycerol kinase
MKEYILSIDQGTTATKIVLYDLNGNVKKTVVKPITIITPARNWVEHSPEKIFLSITDGIREILDNIDISPKEVIGVAVDNQGETIIPFNKTTLEPLYNAIVWQDNRTSEEILSYKNKEFESYIEKTTGLFVDPYFSAPKMKWLIDNVPEVKNQMGKNNLVMATSEVWILNRIIKKNNYYTDVTTASRTLLFDIDRYAWDDKIIDYFGLNKKMLPEITPSVFEYGITDPEICCGIEAPVMSSVVDQHSALFGHRCFNKGEAKLTLGTGGFLLVNVGSEIPVKKEKLITTVFPQIKNEKNYIVEGGIYTVGSAIDWLKNKIGLFDSLGELNQLFNILDNNVFFVPALAGLSAPYWTSESKGAFIGMGLETDKNHMIKAVLESLVFRVNQILELIKTNGIETITSLSVDGGVSNNEYLMNYLAEVSGIEIIKPEDKEIATLGGCFLTGLGLGIWTDTGQIKKINKQKQIIKKNINKDYAAKYEKWRDIVDKIIDI